jgi:hypothetical protein
MKNHTSLILGIRHSGALARLVPALAAGLLAGLGLPAQAVVDPGASVSGSYFTNTSATGYVFGNNDNQGYNPTVGNSSYSHGNAAHNLSGNAFMGSVKLFNEVVRTTNGTSRGAIAGGFQEMITISDPARTGNQGVFTGSIHIHMDQTVTGQVYNNLFGVYVAGSMGLAKNPGGKYAEQSYNWFGSAPISLDNDLAFSIGFTFGTAFDVGVWMASYVEVGGYGSPGTIQHNALNTLAWNGISAVQDTTMGQTVAPEDYTATGSQGMDWAEAVPEPASGLLLGMAAVHFLVRRPRRSQV